ncbi:MAG: hypothetical protein ABR986_01880 [Methanomassiliicoccales archaeon]|jgi:hypothetical protein
MTWASDLFELFEGLEFLEQSYEQMLDDRFTDEVRLLNASESRMLIDEEEWPLSFAVKTPKGWRATSFLLRKPKVEVVERYETLGGEIFQTEKAEFAAAMREHFSERLLQQVPPAIEDFSPERCTSVQELISEVWGEVIGKGCLDVACGSGLGSAALRQLGLFPISYDNDPGLLALGMRTGRLMPEGTMCIDATRASVLAPKAPLGLILMAGSINNFNEYIWKAIVEETLKLTVKTLVTVETEKEAGRVKVWCIAKGREVELFENNRDAFYDRWVCSIY